MGKHERMESLALHKDKAKGTAKSGRISKRHQKKRLYGFIVVVVAAVTTLAAAKSALLIIVCTLYIYVYVHIYNLFFQLYNSVSGLK